jgi:hypothetical protein
MSLDFAQLHCQADARRHQSKNWGDPSNNNTAASKQAKVHDENPQMKANFENSAAGRRAPVTEVDWSVRSLAVQMRLGR